MYRKYHLSGIGECLNKKVPEQDCVRIGQCQNKKVSGEYESFRMGKLEFVGIIISVYFKSNFGKLSLVFIMPTNFVFQKRRHDIYVFRLSQFP